MGQIFKPGIFWAAVVSILEFVGGIFLLAGFLVQLVAVLIAIQFAVIILKMKMKKGLADGYEFDLIIFCRGNRACGSRHGAYSLENFLGILIY